MGKLKISLDKLTVVKKNEVNKDEPYLWIFGIVIDSDTLLKDKSPIIKKNPKDGNLRCEKFKKGESADIPEKLGIIQKAVVPIPLVNIAVAGLIVFAWEHDTTSRQAQTEAYDATADTLEKAILGNLENLNANSASLSNKDIDKIAADIEEIIKEIYKKDAKWFNIFGGLADDFIGQDSCILQLESDISKNLRFKFNEKKGSEYKIDGKFIYIV